MDKCSRTQAEKIYRWVGWKPTNDKLWKAPDGTYTFYCPTSNLNDLFQWVIPKLQKDGLLILLDCYECSGFKATIKGVTSPRFITVSNDDLVIALANAIEKYIDEVKI